MYQGTAVSRAACGQQKTPDKGCVRVEGLKPTFSAPGTARVKSCPDTKRLAQRFSLPEPEQVTIAAAKPSCRRHTGGKNGGGEEAVTIAAIRGRKFPGPGMEQLRSTAV